LQQESEGNIRAFVALPVAGDVKIRLAALQRELGTRLHGAKWTSPAGLHLTIKFLGEISAPTVEMVITALDGMAAGPPFDLGFSRLGVFPDKGKARVLWIGSETGNAECVKLAGMVEKSMEEVGFPREKRPFKAHLTLARFRIPSGIPGEVLDSMTDIQPCAVDRVVLYRSVLKPSGAEYSEIHSIRLE